MSGSEREEENERLEERKMKGRVMKNRDEGR